jgi:hypothetical protein
MTLARLSFSARYRRSRSGFRLSHLSANEGRDVGLGYMFFWKWNVVVLRGGEDKNLRMGATRPEEKKDQANHY